MSNITRAGTPILHALEKDKFVQDSNPTEIRARKNDTLNNGKSISYRSVSKFGGLSGWLSATFSFASRRETALNIREEIKSAFGKHADQAVAAFNKQFKGNVWGFKPITDVSLREFVEGQKIATSPDGLKQIAIERLAEGLQTKSTHSNFFEDRKKELTDKKYHLNNPFHLLSPQDEEELRICNLLLTKREDAHSTFAYYDLGFCGESKTVAQKWDPKINSTESFKKKLDELVTRAEIGQKQLSEIDALTTDIETILHAINPEKATSLPLARRYYGDSENSSTEHRMKDIIEDLKVIKQELTILKEPETNPEQQKNAREKLTALFALSLHNEKFYGYPQDRFKENMEKLPTGISAKDFIDFVPTCFEGISWSVDSKIKTLNSKYNTMETSSNVHSPT